MKNAIISVALLSMSTIALSGQTAVTSQWVYPQARVNVRVVDEAGNSLAGVKAELAFCSATNHLDGAPIEGITDANGLFIAQGFCDGRLGTRLTKDGYYLGAANIPQFRKRKDGQWQPWDATYTTVLRKIENPVPVYAKWAWLTVPELGKPCGYDLMEGDWVAPWGKGKVPDFVFTMKSTYSNYLNYEVAMDLSFSAPLDGILKTELPKEFAQSEFKWPRQAPDAGYQPTWHQEFGTPNKLYRIPDIEKQKFFFRVRTVEKDGKIVSALYGKLWEGFQIGAENPKKFVIRLSYYLNPTPLDRNMEFDLKRNLLKKVGQFEEPRRP